jgi:AraC-like DNA-binding protein
VEDAALQLIEQTEDSHSEIALSVGYSDLFSFSMALKYNVKQPTPSKAGNGFQFFFVLWTYGMALFANSYINS